MTGELNKEILGAVLNILPVEITFVDRNDMARHFNKNDGSIFPAIELHANKFM